MCDVPCDRWWSRIKQTMKKKKNRKSNFLNAIMEKFEILSCKKM